MKSEKTQTYTAVEVLEIINISLPTLDRWQRRGVLVPVIGGGKGAIRRYSKAQIDDLLAGKKR